MEHVTLAGIFEGNVPPTLEGKTAISGELVKLARRIVPVTAMLVAASRRDHFHDQPEEWIDWCMANFPLDKAELYHRRQIGNLLLAVKDLHTEAVFRRLFELDSRKLLPIASLTAKQIPGFLSHYRVEELSRQQVRNAVAVFLGKKPKVEPDEKDQPELPGFESGLQQLEKLSEKQWQMVATDENKAERCLTTGMGLLGAALEYHKRQRVADVELLLEAKVALLDEVREIEETISRSLPELTE